MITDHQLKEIVNFLQLKQIKISIQNEWLKGCCSFYEESDQRENIGNLYNFVYEQWLLADLCDIGESALPSNVKVNKCICLNETYALQVNETLDISESCYSQLQKIRNVSLNTELPDENNSMPVWKSKHVRLLKLTLTDGVQTVYGIEYEPIPALKEPFVPGFKVLVIGPIECRRGVFFLAPRNVRILGGEADSLIVCNATENILARTLNLEENPNPFDGIRPTVTFINESGNGRDGGQTAPVIQVNRVPENNLRNEFVEEEVDDDLLLCNQLMLVENQYNVNLPNTAGITQNSATSQSQDYEQSRNFSSYEVKSSNTTFPNSSLYNLVGDFSRDNRNSTAAENNFNRSRIIGSIDLSKCQDNSKTAETIPNNMNSIHNKWPSPTFSGNSKMERTPVIGVACPMVFRKRNAESPPLPTETAGKVRQKIDESRIASTDKQRAVAPSCRTSTVSSGSVLTSSHLTKLTVNELRNPANRVSGLNHCIISSVSVEKLISKPRIRHNTWHVSVEIVDQTGKLEVTFNDKFLEDHIFGISALEVSSQKERMTLNLNVKERIDQILRTGVQKLLSLTGDFHVEIRSDLATPTIVGVI